MMKCIERNKIDVGVGSRACPDFTAGNHKLKGNHRGLPLQKDLPEGWDIVTLNNVCEINPRLDKSKFPVDMEVSFVPMAAVGASDGKIDVSQKRPFYEVKKGFTPFQSGDVLFAKITPCMENGKMAVVPRLVNECGFGSTEFHVVRPNHGTDARYIYYYVSCENFRWEAAHNMTGAVGQKRVSASYLREQKIPLAPLRQQKLIVSEIEKQFSRLDEAVAALKRVRASLKRYKASVLKAAVEGKLTEEWRKNQISDLAQDKKIRDNNLPLGWIWEKVSDLGDVVTGTTPTKARKEYYDSKDYPFFKPTDLNYGYYVKKSEDGLSKKGIEKARLLPTKSILVTCIGATIGKTGLIRVSGAFNQQINAIVPKKDVLSEFVYFVCISPQFQKSIVDNASATTLPILNKRKFEMLTMPMPPLIEQQKIIEEIESHFSVAEEIEETIDINLKRAERLRQAILKKAFSGRLV